MNVRIDRAGRPKRERGPRPSLRPARFEDYDQLIRLEATLNPATLPPDEWRRLWLNHPLWPEIGSWWPIGWVIETPAGEIVGCMGNVPLRYHFRGERLLAATGRAWVVLPEHRSYGSALRLLTEHYQQPSIAFVLDTSVSQEGSERFSYRSNRIPAGDWEAIAYFVTGYSAFALRALQKLKIPLAQALAPAAGIGLRLKDAVFGNRLRKHPAFAIEHADRFDSRFDGFWSELLRQKPETLLAARDSATLSWHFTMPMRKGRLWILTASRNNRLRAYCVFERKDSGQELRRMRLVDYQTIEPEADLLADLVAAALRRCVAEEVSVLDKSGLGLAKMRSFENSAPYRRKQPWPFWYKSADEAFARELRRPEIWEPTEYDGDASIG
jgi:hypothetical protein